MWMNILAFTVANQRLPNSVIEDSVNKAWRPLPSGRITQVQARRLLLAILPVTFFLNMSLGGLEVTLTALVLTWMYNDLGGADENYIIRNLINACGLVSWSAGTTLVACGKGRHTLNTMGYTWLAIEAAIIFTTLHVQDLRDQEGDIARDRKTAPIVWGDAFTRWTIAIPVMSWTFLCPLIWNLGVAGFLVPLIPGGILALRVMFLRTVEADKITWKLWGIWIASLFILPLISNPSVFYSLNSAKVDLPFTRASTNHTFDRGFIFLDVDKVYRNLKRNISGNIWLAKRIGKCMLLGAANGQLASVAKSWVGTVFSTAESTKAHYPSVAAVSRPEDIRDLLT